MRLLKNHLKKMKNDGNLTVASIQTEIYWENKQKNIERLKTLIMEYGSLHKAPLKLVYEFIHELPLKMQSKMLQELPKEERLRI